MSLFRRDTTVIVPADQVPSWVRTVHLGITFDVVLATIVVYDARKYSFDHRLRLTSLFFCQSVPLTKRYVRKDMERKSPI